MSTAIAAIELTRRTNSAGDFQGPTFEANTKIYGSISIERKAPRPSRSGEQSLNDLGYQLAF